MRPELYFVDFVQFSLLHFVVPTVAITTTATSILVVVIGGLWRLVAGHLLLAGGLEVCWMFLLVRIIVFEVDY